MIQELGQFSLILAFAIAILLGVYPLLGAQWGRLGMMSTARPLAYAQFLLLLLSFLCLTWAFIDNDFTVQYVATNSNTLLPLAYRISAAWGAHEGSLLLKIPCADWRTRSDPLRGSLRRFRSPCRRGCSGPPR